MCLGFVFRDKEKKTHAHLLYEISVIYKDGRWYHPTLGSFAKRILLRSVSYLFWEVVHMWKPSQPAPYASCKIPPSEAVEKSSLFPSPPGFLQLLWSHRTRGNSDASWPEFITIWKPEWDAWCCHHHFHLPPSQKFITHRVILANESYLVHYKEEEK